MVGIEMESSNCLTSEEDQASSSSIVDHHNQAMTKNSCINL
jgi:hypothetical protein